MPLDPLATVADLEGRLGRSFDAAEITRAGLLLADASAAVRTLTGQEFSAGESTTRLRVRNGRVRLPQEPVTDVTAVTDVYGNTVTFLWDDVSTLSVASFPYPSINGPSFGGQEATVDVTYDHGYAEIPGDVVAVVCQMAGRALGLPADQSGMSSETISDYAYRIGSAAAAGAVGMLPEEKSFLLKGYGRVGGTAWVSR